MKTDVTLIVSEALTALEETAPASQVSELPTSADVLEWLVEESVRAVLMTAPITSLTGVLGLGNQINWDSSTTGHIVLPDDFFRLIEFRMTDWKRSVFTPLVPGSEEYDCQSDEQSPWRGSPDFPAVTITASPLGRTLRFISCLNDLAKVEKFLYLPLPYVDTDGRIDVPPLCRRAVVYEMARRFCILRGDNERAEAFKTFNTR